MDSDTLIRRTGWSAAGTTAALASRFAASVICARVLGAADTGRLVYMLWLADLLASLSFACLQSVLTRFVAELRGSGRERDAAALARWVARAHLALLVAAAGTIAALQTLGVSAGKPRLAPLLVAYLALQGWGSLYAAYLEGTQRFDVSTRLNVAAGLVLVSGAAAGASFMGLTGALAAYTASAAVAAAAGWRELILRRAAARVAPLGSDVRGRVRRYALAVWIASAISVVVWSRSEVFFLERFWNAEAVAMYGVGLFLATLVAQVSVLLSGALLPFFAERTGDPDMVQRAYAAATRLAALVAFPLAIGGAAVAPALVTLIYGPAYAAAAPAAAVLVAFSALGVANVGSAMLYGLERASFIAWGGVVGALLFVAAGFTVVPRWGTLGAAWARGAVQLAMVALGTWYIIRRLGYAAPLASLGRTLAVSLVAAAVARLVALWAPGLGGLAPAVAAGALTYVVVSRRARLLAPDDAEALRRGAQALAPPLARPVRAAVGWLAAGT